MDLEYTQAMLIPCSTHNKYKVLKVNLAGLSRLEILGDLESGRETGLTRAIYGQNNGKRLLMLW